MSTKTIQQLSIMDWSEIADDDLLIIFDVSDSDPEGKEQAILRAASSTKSIKVGDFKRFLNQCK